MLELIVIRNLLNQTYYNKYRPYIKLKKEDKELNHLYGILDFLMDSLKRNITLDEYKLNVLTKYPDYKEFTSQIEQADIAESVLNEAVEELVNRSIAYDLAMLSIDVSEGKKPVDQLYSYYDTNVKHREKIEEVSFVTDDLEELYEETVHTPGLRWRLSVLNRMLGSLRKGDFGFIFARPETGKTTFLASEVTYFAEQLTNDAGPILWFNFIRPFTLKGV